MNTSKYRGGRQGYQHFEEEIAKDFEAQGIHIEKVPRHLTWLKAHENKADESYAPADLEIAEAIKSLDAQARKGGIATAGRDDILAKVMQKPEHGGRVRAVGSGITNKEYFGSADRPKYSQMLEAIRCLRSQMDQMATMHNSMITYLMACSQQQGSQFTQEKLRKFVIHGSGLGQSSDVDDQFGVSGGQSGGFGQFSQSGGASQLANTRQCGMGSQIRNVSKSRSSSEPSHDPEPGTSYDSEPGTGCDSEPGIGYTSEPEIDHIPQSETGYVSEPQTDHIPQPETSHLLELETDRVPHLQTGRVPEPETIVNIVSEAGHVPDSEKNRRTLLEAGHVPVLETDHIPVSEHFVGTPPAYSTTNIEEVRSSWIHYVFQHKKTT